MKKYTVHEYAQILGVSNTAIYKKIRKGQIASRRESINNKDVTVVFIECEEDLNNSIGSQPQRGGSNLVGNPVENIVSSAIGPKNDQVINNQVGNLRSNEVETTSLNQGNMPFLQQGNNPELQRDSTSLNQGFQPGLNKVSNLVESNNTTELIENTELITKLIEDNSRMNNQIIELSHKYMAIAQLAGQAKLLMDSENRIKDEYFQSVQENKTLIQQQAELKAKLELKEEKLKQLEEQLNNTHSSLASWFKKL